MTFHVLQLIVSIFLVIHCGFAATNKVVCYYESWGEDTLTPEEIDPNVCTHINYAFLGIYENGSLFVDDIIDNEGLFKRLNALKSVNPELKIFISIGGWTDYAETFSKVASDSSAKSTLIDDSLWFLSTYNLDGVDLGWEFPTADEKEIFNDLLSSLKEALDKNGNYELSIAANHIPNDYDAETVSNTVDFINVLTYDLHNGTDGKTGQNSALYASITDTAWERNNSNCNGSISNWIDAGAAPEKLILGLAFYGKAFVLADPKDHGVGAPIKSGGDDGGSHYRDICQLTDGWTEVWDDEQKNPYKYSGDQWIGFDNPDSIALKVRYAKNMTLGGVMFWVLNYDDKDGNCGPKNALQQAIIDNLYD